MSETWVVRLGKLRGSGEYVTPEAAVFLCLCCTSCLRTSKHQRDARRFTLRWLAERYAEAFGGRVVRLRLKEVKL